MGNGNRAGVVSDWLEMEQKRGISINSTALQFAYGDVVINLLDMGWVAGGTEVAAVASAVRVPDIPARIAARTTRPCNPHRRLALRIQVQP